MRWGYKMYTIELTEQELNELVVALQYFADHGTMGTRTEQVKELMYKVAAASDDGTVMFNGYYV